MVMDFIENLLDFVLINRFKEEKLKFEFFDLGYLIVFG